MTVTNTGASNIRLTNSPTLDVSGRATRMAGPNFDPMLGANRNLSPGLWTVFTWTWSTAGTANLTFTSEVCATLTPTGIPSYTVATASVSVGDTGETAVFSVDRNLLNQPKSYPRKEPWEPREKNEAALISFNLREAGNTTLTVYNSVGRRIKVLFNGYAVSRQDYDRWWDGTNDAVPPEKVASGVYYFRLEGPRFVATKKVALIK
jgi:hypothetical protein